jgi:type IV pilus assembly protein PilB
MEELKDIPLKVSLQQVINSEIANHYQIIPQKISDTAYEFLISHTKQNELHDIKQELKLLFDKDISLIPAPDELVKKYLSKYFRKSLNKSSDNFTTGDDYLNNIIFEARSMNSSDIHIEIYDDNARVRYRIDGRLIEKKHIEKKSYKELINQIKIKSNLDITEKRLPQDGRIEFDNFDVRVSILPIHHGEKVVMRILGRDASHLDLWQLGMEDDDLSQYLEAVKKSNGIVLISGPTGSGKTTTLYATLKYLNNTNCNIVTVEDPIEYTLKGINQVQLKEGIGLTFTSALRSFLRQDPDIIMLGEIRDSETAQMAIRASLTGHLVLSTIHTNSSLGTISRLIDMGVPEFLISETLNISVAQRLVRVLCKDCKKEVSLKRSDLPSNFKPKEFIKTHFIPTGCNECYFTGYKGRKAIYEVLPIDNKMADAIKSNSLNNENKFNYNKLSDKAYDMLKKGVTSLDEIYSIIINI